MRNVVAATIGVVVLVGAGLAWRYAQEAQQTCRSNALSDHYFGGRKTDEGYALVNVSTWAGADFELRGMAAEIEGICHFGPLGYDIRHPKSGRVLATWSLVRGYRSLE